MKSNSARFFYMVAFLLLSFGFTQAQMKSEKAKTVGGVLTYPTKNIIENAVNSKDHTTLVAAVKAAGLVKTLEGPYPLTVVAPTNEAFEQCQQVLWITC